MHDREKEIDEHNPKMIQRGKDNHQRVAKKSGWLFGWGKSRQRVSDVVHSDGYEDTSEYYSAAGSADIRTDATSRVQGNSSTSGATSLCRSQNRHHHQDHSTNVSTLQGRDEQEQTIKLLPRPGSRGTRMRLPPLPPSAEKQYEELLEHAQSVLSPRLLHGERKERVKSPELSMTGLMDEAFAVAMKQAEAQEGVESSVSVSDDDDDHFDEDESQVADDGREEKVEEERTGMDEPQEVETEDAVEKNTFEEKSMTLKEVSCNSETTDVVGEDIAEEIEDYIDGRGRRKAHLPVMDKEDSITEVRGCTVDENIEENDTRKYRGDDKTFIFPCPDTQGSNGFQIEPEKPGDAIEVQGNASVSRDFIPLHLHEHELKIQQDEFSKKIKGLEDDIAEIKKKAEYERHALEEEWQEREHSLKNQNHLLEDTCSKLARQVAFLKSKLSRMEHDMKESQHDLQVHKSVLQSKKSMMESLSSEQQCLIRENSRLMKDKNALEDQNRQLMTIMQQLLSQSHEPFFMELENGFTQMHEYSASHRFQESDGHRNVQTDTDHMSLRKRGPAAEDTIHISADSTKQPPFGSLSENNQTIRAGVSQGEEDQRGVLSNQSQVQKNVSIQGHEHSKKKEYGLVEKNEMGNTPFEEGKVRFVA